MRIPWRRILRPHNLLATVFIFLVMGLLSFIHIDHHRLDPFTYGIRDYDVTDIVYSRLRKKEIQLDTNIVLVNTGTPSRLLLHQLLERIESAKPKVVGVDIFLEEQKDPYPDSLLHSTLERYPNIVLATRLEGFSEQNNFFDREVGCDTLFSNHARKGFANFPGNKTHTVRWFSPNESVQGFQSNSFAIELTRLYRPEAVEQLEKRHNKLERIHYSSNVEGFLRFEPETILDTTVNLAEVMAGKVILVGYMNDYSPDDPIVDRFFTPLNQRYTGRTIPDMYGMVIHANIIRMVLNADYINLLPGWITFLFALTLVYANTFFFFWNYKYFWYFKRFPKILYRWAHLVQVVEIALMFLLTAWVFYAFHLKIDLKVAIVGIVLAFDLCIIYYYLRQNIAFLGKIPDHFPVRTRHPKKPNPAPTPADDQEQT